MNYCDFNPRLFKEFISMKTKIKPAMSDDWEIVPRQYRTIDGFSLRSAKLNQEVADINLRRFLQFSKEQNLVIEGLNLKGTYIVGNDRSVYTEEMFNTWKDKYTKRTENIIPKEDYKLGHEYKTPCGMHMVYLGFRYSSRVNQSEIKKGNYSKIGKIEKKHFVVPKSHAKSASRWYHNVTQMNKKFTEDIGKYLTEAECDNLLNIYYEDNRTIACWEKEKPKSKEYTLVEYIPSAQMKQNPKVLFAEYDNKIFEIAERSTAYLSYDHQKKMYYTNSENEVAEDFKSTARLYPLDDYYSYYRNKSKMKKVDKLYRLGIKDA